MSLVVFSLPIQIYAETGQAEGHQTGPTVEWTLPEAVPGGHGDLSGGDSERLSQTENLINAKYVCFILPETNIVLKSNI